jgi:hypothetical protein
LAKREEGNPPRPAPYSTTDAAEIDAVTTLRSLLDTNRVRADLRERDKYPNIDGYFELVDDGCRPQGKIEVQIKKLVAGATSCRCPSSLVAYSKESTTLPVILVGVDPSSPRAYWMQVSEAMPGYQGTQETFTVHFTGALDAIDRTASCPCYHRWLELVREYQERIQRYPLLAPDSTQRGRVTSLTRQHWEALQHYVDTLNRLLDDDLIVVKKLLFPAVWKFGVGCRLIDQELVLYQLSSIPRGEPGPLIFELPAGITPTTLERNVQTSVVQARQKFFTAPEQCAREHVLGFVRDLWRAKAFPVHGLEMAADVVLGFVQRYHRWLEIPPDSDEYRLEDLRRAFGPVLSKTTGAVAGRMRAASSSVQIVDLDVVVNQPANVSTASPEDRGIQKSYMVSSNAVPISLAFASLALLSSSRAPTVRRSVRTRDLEYQPPPNNFIWSCYSREREIDNATAVLNRALREYEMFIRGNALHFESSPYLDRTVSIVFEYVSSHANPQGPVLREWQLRDPNRALEKTTVLVADASRQLDAPHVVINNMRFEVAQQKSRSANFLFGDCPLSNFVYQLLADDLHSRYQMTLR